jgi:ectoine hydroxylase-related dioxygenase (phytanoyl-CoA dioxygenase family)
VQILRAGLEAVRRAGWPAVFSCIYDEFWRVMRARPIVEIARSLLGPDVLQRPHFWMHYVAPYQGSAGWAPHVDSLKPGRITLWIALSEATLNNGCMYAIPRSTVPDGFIASLESPTTVDWNDACALLQNCRPLPCPAGSMLGWAHDVLHWGAACRHATAPRISLSFEFVSGEEVPSAGSPPLMLVDPLHLPTFSQRLQMISHAILSYERFNPKIACYREVARRLIDEAT